MPELLQQQGKLFHSNTKQLKLMVAGFPLTLSSLLYGQDKPDSDLDFMIGKIREAYAGYAAKVARWR